MSRPVKNRTGPRQRRDGLVVQELPEETLVYDLERHKAHCLEVVAAAVWEACDGERTVGEIAARATKRIGRRVPDDAAWLALRRLGRARLLEAPVAAPVAGRFTSRPVWPSSTYSFATVHPCARQNAWSRSRCASRENPSFA